jgi:hypothetical protein
VKIYGQNGSVLNSQTAKNFHHLDLKLVINETVILTDVNGEQWVRCLCGKRFHLHCVANLPKDVQESDFEINFYICDYCGWFMSGEYDSDSA